MFKIGLHYALRNIMRTPLRSFFTLFSIALIISLYTIINGIGDSFTGQLTKLFSRQNVDIIVQSKYSVTPLSSHISNAMVEKLANLDEVQAHGVLVIGKINFHNDVKGYMIGVTDIEQFAQQLGLSIVEGHADNQKAGEMMIAKQLAKALKVKLGDRLTLSEDKSFKIIAIYETWIGFFNTSMIGSKIEAQELLHIKNRISMLNLTLKEPHKSQAVIDKINENYPALKAIKSGDFSQALGPLKTLFSMMQIISMVTLIIASAIMLNTFIMAISERTKEIGILLAIGWSKRMIMGVLMIESVVLSVVGGIIGFFVSYPILYIIKQNYQSIHVYMPSSLGVEAFVDAILICLVIGVVSILFPAFYGTRLDISKALHDK